MENIVALVDEGDIGAYNRANRSVHHMVENFGALIAGVYMAGIVMPFPTFVAILIYAAARIAHQIG
jgi:hypothetical protein